MEAIRPVLVPFLMRYASGSWPFELRLYRRHEKIMTGRNSYHQMTVNGILQLAP